MIHLSISPPARHGLLTAGAVLVLDFISKLLLLDVWNIAEQPVREVLPFFNLVLVWNRGISFGMLAEHEAPYILAFSAVLITLVLLRWLMKTGLRSTALALGLVIGGAVGNVVDRLRFGAVADFFDFHVAGYHWPAFNVADSAITIGVLLLCWDSVFRKPF